MTTAPPLTRAQQLIAEQLREIHDANGAWVRWSTKRHAARNHHINRPCYERAWRRGEDGTYGLYVRLVGDDRSVWGALDRLLALAEGLAAHVEGQIIEDVATVRGHFAPELESR